MRTRSSYSNLVGESSPNPTTSNLKRRNRRRSKQPFILEESPVDTMADQRTMAELLRVPTEGYAEVCNSRNKSIVSQVKSRDANFSSSSEIAKLTNAVNHQTSAVTTAMTAILKQFQATPPPASIKAVEEICVTCGGAHPYYHGLVLDGPSIPMPSPFINPEKDERVEETLTDSELDPGKFLIPCGFSELKCKALADLGASINLMPLSVWKKLVPLILGRPFLRTARALIDVHGKELILRDGDERLTLNMKHDTLSYSNQPKKESINMINIYDDSYEDYLEDLFATNHLSGNPTFSPHTDLTSPEVINSLSGSTTSYSPDHLLEEFADELALITFPSRNDDLPFDIESDLREIEYLLNHDPTKEMDSILEDSVDEDNLANRNDNLVDTILEMFIDEHTLDYSSPALYDEYDDDLCKIHVKYRSFHRIKQ
uniref:Reverse transcriptase domain-containing protein n=1 Tax=Tanacetum cinerariifolium TaxID=118510 RepID=A0A6L2JGR3_TANCI|nr:hypothetical protein [Tanacetum cinerariifolium]